VLHATESLHDFCVTCNASTPGVSLVRLYLFILSISFQGIGLFLHESGVKPGPLAPASPIHATCLLQEFIRIKECSHEPLPRLLPGLPTCIEAFLFTFPSPLVAFIVMGVLRLIALPQTLIIMFTAMTDTMLRRRLCRGSRGARGTLRGTLLLHWRRRLYRGTRRALGGTTLLSCLRH